MSSGDGASNPNRREPTANEPTALQRAIAALEKMKARLDNVERAANEPIAVVGMGCRFPGGGNGTEAFWQALDEGVDAIREIPPSRWSPEAIPGDRPAARWAALLDDIEKFDAAFFEISPREAETLDPQQRMLLEVTHEALEDAGLRPDLLFGTQTGVFIGICGTDHQLIVGDARQGSYDAYCTTGNLFSTAAGRISFVLGFQGPALSIDTACSSSLVAIAQGCQSIRAGDCNVAVVGGVNAVLAPRSMAMLLETQALSPDGRCKTLDSRANGFVRGEGCGLLVLKRLSEALRDGDRIRGIIRGWSVNQDGRSTGLTTPNVLSQQALIRQALERAKLTPADIGYIEMHGTGTALGDPIEAEALREVLGAPRTDGSSCVLGAVKSNIGHLEGAAGVAGVIKVLLAMEHERIPQNLHFRRLNPRISFAGTPFIVPTTSVSWLRGDKPRRAGVSSFGISGTNAHVIVEETPAEATKATPPNIPGYLLPLSAKTPQALTALVQSYAKWFSQENDAPLYDIVHTASLRRTHHDHRLAVIGQNREDFANLLTSFLRDEAPAGVVQGRASAHQGTKVVFVFSGQGSQWAGMGISLLDKEPVFRAKVEEIDAHVRKQASFGLLDELRAPPETSRLERTEIVQVALFAIQVGLAELFKHWGLTPHAVMGHSVGEIAAAHVSGAISLEDAVRLVVLRGRIMDKATGRGKMVWAAMPPADAERALVGIENEIAIAAINDPSSVVLSGMSNTVDAIVADLGNRGVVTRALRVNYAFHSPQMDPLAEELVATLGHFEANDGNIAFYSTVNGALTPGHSLTASYWGRNVRETVNLANAIRSAMSDDHRVIVEVGPHPVLLANLQQCAAMEKSATSVIPTLRRQRDGHQDVLETLGALFTAGVDFDWKSLYSTRGRVVSLPTYPWQKERYWIEVTPSNNGLTRDALADDFYSVEWRRQDQTSSENSFAESSGAWLVFLDNRGTGEALATELEARGQECIRVRLENRFSRLGSNEFTIHVECEADFQAVLREAFGTAAQKHCRGIIYLPAIDVMPAHEWNADTLQASQRRGLFGFAALCRSILDFGWRKKPPLCLVTRGAVHTSMESSKFPAHSTMWGFGRTLALEHAEITCKRIDLSAHESPHDSQWILREIADSSNEDEIVLRNGARYVSRLVRTRVDAPSATGFSLRGDATYLITGGLGGLGLSIAEWMVRTGARNIVLLGRRGPSEEIQAQIRQWEQKYNTKVWTLRADVARLDELAAAFDEIARIGLPLRGIVHAAGVAREAQTVHDFDVGSVEQILAPKVVGTWNLHTLSQSSSLDFFVLYSSASAVLGLVGQAGYAAANAFLDALAGWRVGQGLTCMSIQWGAMAAAGMAGENQLRNRMAHSGMGALTPENGVAALARLLEHPRPNIAFMKVDPQQWRNMLPQFAANPYVSELLTAEGKSESTQSTMDSGIRRAFDAANAIEKVDILESHVRSLLEQILKLPSERIERDAPFSSLGMDSLMGLELRNRLTRSLGIDLPNTLIFAYPTLSALMDHLVERLSPEEPTVETNADELLEESNHLAADVESAGEDDVESRLQAKLLALDKYLD